MGIMNVDPTYYFGLGGDDRYKVDLADTKQAFIRGEIGEEEAEPMRRNLSPEQYRSLLVKRFANNQSGLIAAASAESHTGRLLAAFITEMF